MPPIDRQILRQDLRLLPRLLAGSLHSALPMPLRMAVSREVLIQQLSGACSRLAESPDADLVPLIDTLGQELGAIRGILAPIDQAYLEAHPGLAAALDRTVKRLG
jgi:hypothetical protein